MDEWERSLLRIQCRNAFAKRDHKEAVQLLRLQDPDVLHKDELNLLYDSISNGWLDVTRDLITNYCFNPNKYYNGKSCLYTAAKGNHVDIVEYFIKECGCDPMMHTYSYGSGDPVLHYVAREGLLDVLKCIINECNCDIMITDKDSIPFLHYVASEGLLDVLKCMVMNINGHIMDEQYRDTNGRTVLHCAVKHIDVVKYLINECNCDAMTPDKDGNTILHDAASEGLLDVMKYLINTHYCNPMTTNNRGQTVLHCAVKHIDVVKYLINEYNCDIMVTDKDGVPFLHYVASEGLLDVLKCMVMNINGHIMNKQYRDTNGQTVLHHAVKHIDVVKYLINECNCDIMATDKNGVPFLHYVAREGLLDVLKCMVMNINGHIMDEQYHDTNGRTVLHCAVKHIDVVKYLINECNCDIMATDKNGVPFLHYVAREGLLDVLKCMVMNINGHIMDEQYHDTNGRTVLHCAFKHLNVVEYLINECNCDIMVTDKDSVPFLHYVAREGLLDVLKCIINECNCDIMVTGKDGVPFLHYVAREGLLDVLKCIINECNCDIMVTGKDGVPFLHYVAREGLLDVLKCMVMNINGHIINEKYHDTNGRTVLHCAFKHLNVVKYLINECNCDIMVTDKDSVPFLHYVAREGLLDVLKCIINECNCDIMVTGKDGVPFLHYVAREGLLDVLKCIINECNCDIMVTGKDGVPFLHYVAREGLLDVLKCSNDYVIPYKREDILDAVHLLHSIGLISVLKSEDKVWVVVNKGILLTEVDGILFAPKTFKEHVDIASNTGIVSVSGLTKLFLKYDPDMLICFLKNMELCQELDPSFLKITNLIAGDREETGDSTSETQKRGERLLFFPCLLSTDRPKKMTSEVYQFGWCLQCTREHDFFPPRYFHVLSLHLAFKFSLSKGNKELAEKLNRECKFWSNRLHWFNGHGVGSLIEIVDESQCVLVMMSCEKGYSDNMVSLRRKVIGEVMRVYKESCPSLEVKELVIDPKELAYPVNTPRERTVYDVCGLLSAIKEGRPFLVTDNGHKELKEILPDESLSDISNLSLLGGRDIKEVLGDTYIPTSDRISEPIGQQKVTLTIRDLVDIVRVLKKGNFQTIRWFDLGFYLGLSFNDLMVIETNYLRHAEQCLTECLAKWLTDDIEATWNKLAIATGEIGETSVTSTIATSINIDVLKINDEVQETLTDKLLDIRDLATVLQELTSNQQFDYANNWKQERME
uniref:Death domain-containing protein n=1 Tax=Amphimedon queenslandica TaxID=400682 RepID=A0A1X7UFK8_AMPQE